MISRVLEKISSSWYHSQSRTSWCAFFICLQESWFSSAFQWLTTASTDAEKSSKMQHMWNDFCKSPQGSRFPSMPWWLTTGLTDSSSYPAISSAAETSVISTWLIDFDIVLPDDTSVSLFRRSVRWAAPVRHHLQIFCSTSEGWQWLLLWVIFERFVLGWLLAQEKRFDITVTEDKIDSSFEPWRTSCSREVPWAYLMTQNFLKRCHVRACFQKMDLQASLVQRLGATHGKLSSGRWTGLQNGKRFLLSRMRIVKQSTFVSWKQLRPFLSNLFHQKNISYASK